jgi:hypothetical protein
MLKLIVVFYIYLIKKNNTLKFQNLTTKMQIISVNDDGNGTVNTTISLPCNSEITDELGNTWKLVGPYREVCDSERIFNKLLKTNGRVENREWYCIKDGADKKYANSV